MLTPVIVEVVKVKAAVRRPGCALSGQRLDLHWG